MIGSTLVGLAGMGAEAGSEPELFNKRVSTRFPAPNGADISFSCFADTGEIYFCKADRDGRAIRATEWFFTRLANHVGIATPQCSVMEDPESGETYFGSRSVGSTHSMLRVRAFLLRAKTDELGRQSEWLGHYLAGLYAFDLFACNPDRQLSNFLLEDNTRRLLAFDFASAHLSRLATTQFPIEGTPTLQVGRVLRKTHGFDAAFALEMVDRLAAVPSSLVESILGEIPGEWITSAQSEVVYEAWSDRDQSRLSALRAGLKGGSLL